MEKHILHLDTDGSVITDNESIFATLEYFIDTSFDSRGVLQIKVDCDDILTYHSFVVPRIYSFVVKNCSYDVGIGTLYLDEEYIETFKNFDINNNDQIITLLDISESLDNYYQCKKN